MSALQYSGKPTAPNADAAFVVGSKADAITGIVATGVPGVDGNSWKQAG
ncbi:MAG: hypothetical protein ACYTGZ_09050 [Planctomycetota bacterium]|jgi:hypothetical protein